MYVPGHFEESRVEVLHQLMRAEPFAMLVTMGASGLNANHLPLELDPAPAPFGTLRGHVSRANEVWRSSDPAVEALVVFQGPQRYITPAWYPTKEETGKVVPTWNYYVAAQVRGIVGFELPIARLSGKWKVSQNRGEADRAGVTTGLRADADPASAVMADLVERRT